MKKQVKINGLEKGKEREDMKKRNRRLLAVLCAVVTAAGIAAPAMTPVYAAQNEVTNEEAVNAEVMSAGNTKDATV